MEHGREENTFELGKPLGRESASHYAGEALFQRIGLHSTLIRHENEAFSKPLFKPEELKNTGFAFSCGQKNF